MPDWTGEGRDTAQNYLAMAEFDLHGVSPSYESLCRAVAASADVCALLDRLPPAKRQPNILLAAVRYLAGPIEQAGAFLEFVVSEWDRVVDVVLSHRVQTNEAGRCATLLPVLCALPQPLALVEVGASAGLCLYPDRYRYRYVTGTGQRWLGDSPVVLSCAVTGPVPQPRALPIVAWRAGLDLNPLHADRADDRRWLASLVWPEQLDRAEHLQQALDMIALDPPRIDEGDLLVDLPGLVADAPPEATVVVFHSAVLAYLGPAQRDQFTETMRRLSADRGVHWISNEAAGVVPGADVAAPTPGRFVLAHNQRPLAVAGPHGHTLDWLDG